MDEKNKKMLLMIAGGLGVALVILLIVLFVFSGKDKSKEVVAPEQEKIEVQEKQIQSFQDLKLIEETLASGKKLNEDIGKELDNDAKSVLKDLGVSEELFGYYRVYTSQELLSTKFVLIGEEDDEEEDSEFIVVEDDGQTQEWIDNYGEDQYIISEKQGLAFLLNGREDANGTIQHARLVEDTNTYDENFQDDEVVSNTNINIRKVERLKYNISIDYPENAVEKKYAISVNEKSNEEETDKDEQEDIDYDKLKWLNYNDNIIIEENVTIYTKYKLDKKEKDYIIGNSRTVPELILSTPTYEIVEDETVYLTFSNIESEYNDDIKFKVSYGIGQNEEELTYSDWDKLDENIFKIDQQEKYFIKFAAILPDKNVTESQVQISSIQKSDGETGNIIDTSGENNVKSSNTNLKYVKINGQYLSEELISELNENRTASYNLSSASSIDVKAEAEDINATVVGNRTYGFTSNKATVRLQIVAEDKTKKTVTLKVTRESSGSTSSSKTSTSTSSSKTSTSTTKSCIHSWQAATCTSPRTCKKCGSTSGSPSSHKYQSATCTQPKTCKVCGATTGNALGHNWREATCTEAKECKRCDLVSGAPLGHNWQAATCTEPKKCTRTGCNEKEGTKLGHNWQAATCTEPKKCTRDGCGETYGSALDHRFSIIATCLSPKKCIICGASDPSGKLGSHKWQAATCTTPKTCTVCGATEGEVSAHIWKTVNGAKQCSKCGKTAS